MNQNFQDWEQFIKKLGKLKDVPLPEEQLKSIVKVPGMAPMDFSQIHDHFKNGFQLICNPDRVKWHIKDKYVFIWTMSKYLELSSTKYLQLEENNSYIELGHILGLNAEIVREKWLSLSKSKLKENPWTTEDDELIILLKEKYPENKWCELTNEFNSIRKQTRYQKQIRERWNTVINPEILHESFSEQEGVLLFKLAKEYNNSWAKISKLLKGRTQNAVKNYYNSTILKLSKKIVLKPDESNEVLVDLIIQIQSLDPEQLKYQIDQNRKIVKIEENQSSTPNYIHQIGMPPTYFYPFPFPQSFYFIYPQPRLFLMQQEF